MRNTFGFSKLLLAGAVLAVTVFASCKKDQRVPPDLSFKTTAGYIFGDTVAGTSDTLKVGIVADKTEDELNTLNVSVAYDGGGSATKDNFILTGTQQDHYEADYLIITRDSAGSEKWIFTLTDRDGNITTKNITLTVN